LWVAKAEWTRPRSELPDLGLSHSFAPGCFHSVGVAEPFTLARETVFVSIGARM
jgi:hypothetical protein